MAPRGVYESSFMLAPGVLVLCAVDRHGILRGTRTVTTAAEYDAALADLTMSLDALDPAPPLQLVD